MSITCRDSRATASRSPASPGKLVAEAIAGQAERFDLFTKLQHRNFPGGALLRMPALVLAMLWYRMRDLL